MITFKQKMEILARRSSLDVALSFGFALVLTHLVLCYVFLHSWTSCLLLDLLFGVAGYVSYMGIIALRVVISDFFDWEDWDNWYFE